MTIETKAQVYLSGPGWNDCQKTGLQKIEALIHDAGYEVIVGVSLKPQEGAEQLRHHAHLVVAWLDSVLPVGSEAREVGKLQGAMEIPFPPNVQEMITVGAKYIEAMKAQQPGHRALVLPQHLQKQHQVQVPTSMRIQLDPKVRFAAVEGPPLNLPDPRVMFDVGIAHGLDIPVFTLAMISGTTRSIDAGELATCHSKTLEDLKVALEAFRPVALESATEEFVRVVSALKMRGRQPEPVLASSTEPVESSAPSA